MKLVQKAFHEKREFELLEDGLNYISHEAGGWDEVFIGYNALSGTGRKRTFKNPKLFYIGWSCAVFTIFGAFFNAMGADIRWGNIITWAFGAIVCGILYVISIKKYYLMEAYGNKFIYILLDKPNKAQYEAFMAELQVRRASHLEKIAEEYRRGSEA